MDWRAEQQQSNGDNMVRPRRGRGDGTRRETTCVRGGQGPDQQA